MADDRLQDSSGSAPLARRGNAARLVRLFALVCALLLAAELVVERHGSNPLESLFGFYALFGLGAGIALVFIAREFRKLVIRREDYYDAVDD